MKIVFFDIDGTIYHLRLGIPEDTAEALEALHSRGVLIGLCTSRSLAYIPSELKKISFDVLISSNGARVQVGDDVIKERLFSVNQVKPLLSLIQSHHLVPMLCGPRYVLYDEHILTTQVDSWINLTRKSLDSNFRPLNAYTEDIPVDKICVKVPADRCPESVLSKLGTEPDYSLYISRDADTGRCCEFEVMPALSTKGEGIRLVLEQLNISTARAYAFGDGTNDIPMFQAVGNSIAMGNSSSKVKSCASFVTTHFAEGGIIEGLRRYELI